MFKSRRFSTAYLVTSYVLISALPLLGYWGGQTAEHPLRVLAYELCSWLACWILLKRPRWFHFLLLPTFLALPVEVYLRLYFGQGISTHHLGIITETSPKEAAEFLGYKIWLLILICIGILGWWWTLLKATRNTDALDWQRGGRSYAIAALVLIFLVWLPGSQVGVASADEDSSASSASAVSTLNTPHYWPSWASLRAFPEGFNPLPAWAGVFYDESSLANSWPLGVYMHLWDTIRERRYLNELAEKNRSFQFHTQQTKGKEQPQTIILVIGESSRYDRWSLNGYSRPSNPYLSQVKQLQTLSDMITAVSATRLSVPILATRKPAIQSLKPGFTEKSFLSAFKEAGFKTYWLSNQMSFGQFDTPTSVIAKEADVTQFINLGGFTNGSSLDESLFQPVQQSLKDAATHKLIVLHTLGNHWNYSHRYPAAFDRWKPSLMGVNNPAYTDLKNKEALNNSYDNSILYTDWFLAQLITKLQNRPETTALFYVSDHGQTLYDGSCRLAFHGHNTQYEFHVPAFFWYSDQYAAQYPDKVQQILKHKDARLSTENVFHSMLDMVDIHYADEQLNRSIFSSALAPHTRYVDSYGWSNYDDADFKGDCREVMDRGTPLPR